MAQDLTVKKSNFASRLVDANEGLLIHIDKLIVLRLEYDTSGYGLGNPAPYEITQDDLSPNGAAGGRVTSNLAHLTPQIIADDFSSLEALKTLLVQGHWTNLNRMRR